MFGKTTEYIRFRNNTDLPINVGGFQDGRLKEVKVGPFVEVILRSSVGEWHLDSMFQNDEDCKAWEDRGLQKYHTVGKFRSDPCALGNYSWMEYDDGVFECVYTELLSTEDGIKGHITLERTTSSKN
jgi:hypothetical protein